MKAHPKSSLGLAKGKPPKTELSQHPDPTHEEVAECAYSLWEHRGRPEGEDTDIWLEAEQKLRGGLHLSTSDDRHFADPKHPLDREGDPSGEVEERLRDITTGPDDRSATSL